ncbi:MAG: PAS domain-containing protein [Methanomassiliicoccales archaeon]
MFWRDPMKGKMSEEMVRAVLDSLPVDIVVIDDMDRVVAWNREGRRILLQVGEEVLGKDVRECHSQGSIPHLDRILERMRAGTLDFTRTVMERNGPEGEDRFLVSYIALRDPEGRYLGCMEVDQDLDLSDVGDGGSAY